MVSGSLVYLLVILSNSSFVKKSLFVAYFVFVSFADFVIFPFFKTPVHN